MGLEPTTFGTTIRRSNQLSYIHHIRHFLSNAGAKIISILKPCKNYAKKISVFLFCTGSCGSFRVVNARRFRPERCGRCP